MAISLIAPARGRQQPRFYDLEIIADATRDMVMLTLTRRDGQRLHLFAQPDGALDAAMALTGAVMRLRDQREDPS